MGWRATGALGAWALLLGAGLSCAETPGGLELEPAKPSRDGGADATAAGDAEPGSDAGEVGPSPGVEACPGPGVPLDVTPPNGGNPFELDDPRDLGFSGLPPGRTATVAMAFTNRHDEPARFSASVDGSAFRLDAPTVELAPGASTDWRLSFTGRPVAGHDATELRVEIRRPDRTETRRIAVDAQTVEGPAVTCGPRRFDQRGPLLLPDVSPLRSETFSILCVNRGALPVELIDLGLRSRGSARAIIRSEPVPSRTRPVTLPPFAQARWEVQVCPDHEGPYGASVRGKARLRGASRELPLEGWFGEAEVVGARPSVPDAIALEYQGATRGGSERVRVENTGQEPFELIQVRATAPFTVLPPVNEQQPIRVEPGRSAGNRFVGLVPDALGIYEGRVTVVTDAGSISVPVVARPSPDLDPAPCDEALELPGELDLGVAGPSSSVFTVSVFNPTERACTMELSTTGMLAPLPPAHPYALWTVEPGRARRLWLRVDGSDLPNGAASGELRLRSRNAVAEPRVLRVTAAVDDEAPGYRLEVVGGRDACRPDPDPLTYGLTWVPAPGGATFDRIEAPVVVDVASARDGHELSPAACSPTNAGVDLLHADGRRTFVPLGLQPSGVCPSVPEPALQEDRFEVFGQTEMDIIVVVDDSGSMDAHREALRENLNALSGFLRAQRIDAYVMFASTSSGLFRDDEGEVVSERILDDGFDPAGDRFASLVSKATPRSIERTIDRAIEAARSAPLREAAVLSVVAISDEADQSFATTDQALNELFAIKGFRNTNLFSFSAITGGPEGCSREGRLADPDLGGRFQTLAEWTGGTWASLCTDDWHRSFEQISCCRWGVTRFFLTNQPQIESIEVFVDAVSVPDREPSGRVNWTYDFSTNSISFAPLAVPGPGSKILVRYLAECR